MDKTALRKEIRERITMQSAAYREESDAGIFQNLIDLPEFRQAETVFAYFSIKGEVDTHRMIRHALAMGKRLALPIVLGGGVMVFAAPQGELVEGMSFGIPEPDETAPRLVPRPGDIIIVPALCFDQNGYRLGQGGGYYDRFLEKYPDIFTAGLCRESLFMDAVPRQAHDMAVCCVVTEKRTARP